MLASQEGTNLAEKILKNSPEIDDIIDRHDPKGKLAEWKRQALILKAHGYSTNSLIPIIGKSKPWVFRFLTSEFALDILKEHRTGVIISLKDKLSRLSKKAIDVYEEVLNSKAATFSEKLKAADSVIKAAGLIENKIDNLIINNGPTSMPQIYIVTDEKTKPFDSDGFEDAEVIEDV
jgi:hypothetical protein